MKTKLTLSIGECKTSWSSIYEDCDAYELLEVFVGLMVTQTFSANALITAMQEYIDNHKTEKEDEDED